jgi:NAD(P)-dependent dehydrogenase (short-subunit alcohol dehydrogenase family)
MTIALIGGAGEGLGAALGRRFAKGGLEVVLSSRTQGEKADLREEAQVIDLFDRVEKRGPVQIAVFNAGANFRSSILDTPAEMFEKIWRLGCYAGFPSGARRRGA